MSTPPEYPRFQRLPPPYEPPPRMKLKLERPSKFRRALKVVIVVVLVLIVLTAVSGLIVGVANWLGLDPGVEYRGN